jgi:hypothetical protein
VSFGVGAVGDPGVYGRFAGRRRGATVTPIQVGVTLVAALAMAYFSPAHIQPRLVLVLVGVVVAGVLFSRHPRWCLVAVLATTLFGLYNTNVSVGPITLRVSDGPLALSMAWAIHLRVQRGRVTRNAVGQASLVVLLLVLGASLVASYGESDRVFVDLVVSLLRAAATFSLVWVIPYTLRTTADRMFVLRSLVIAGTAELALALYDFVQKGFPDRLRGDNGPNAGGLIAVVAVIAVLNLPLFKLRYRVLTKSIASIASLMIILGLMGVRASTKKDPRTEALVRPLRVLVLIIGTILLVGTLRPQDLPSQKLFGRSSTAARLSFGYAGIRIFLEHPVLGVGWQRSSRPEVIGAADVVADVQSRFAGLREGERPIDVGTTVHNAYIQVLAEGGVIGGLVLLAAYAQGRRGARAVMAGALTEAALARTVVAELAAVLIWWNDNAIFGAQPETIMFAFFLGMLASIPVANALAARDVGPPRRELATAAG